MTLSALDILKAKKSLEGVVYRTPLTFSKKLSEIGGAQVYLKWENLQKTGSFKFRGAFVKINSLTLDERKQGIITASAGNHAQAIALVAQMLGIKASVVVPETAPKVKVERCRDLQADVILHGTNYDESLIYCKQLVSDTGATYIPAFEDYEVIAGQGTVACEILEEMPETDAIMVPIGGGGLVSGIAVYAKALNPNIRIIGVQSTAAYTMHDCFKAKKMLKVPVPPTIADGLAGNVHQITLDLVLKYVDEIVLAREEELRNAILWILENERQVVEGSGVVGPAAILQRRIQFQPYDQVAVVISGGNIDMELLNLPKQRKYLS
ncbi:MAG: threonine/serine dehydratase [Candidatus Hodarchaeota archaeon]